MLGLVDTEGVNIVNRGLFQHTITDRWPYYITTLVKELTFMSKVNVFYHLLFQTIGQMRTICSYVAHAK